MRMGVIEVATIGVIFISLTQRAIWSGSATVSWSLVGFSAGLVLIALVVNPMRWQLAPAIVVLLIILIQMIITIRGGELANGLSVPLFLSGVVLLAVSTALAWGLPAGRLTAPEGPFKVGVITSELIRPDPTPERPSRHLTIKAWYPALSGSKPRKIESLWSEVHELREIPVFVRALLAYLKRVKTHSIIGAPLAVDGAPHPLLIYNHSLLSFASENTLLMEWLASRGYIVLSIRHRDQAAELSVIQEGISEEEQARDRELNALLGKKTSRAERARLSLELFRNSTGMSAIVRRRAEDSVYVMNNLDAALAKLPSGRAGSVASSESFGALGLSLGGAVATKLCLVDERCIGAANLDGGLYGIGEERPLPSPYLMIYSEDNAGTNDAFTAAAQEGFAEYVLPRAKHLDLHDAAVALPGLKWFHMLGEGSGNEKNRCLKETVTAFFDRAMKHTVGTDAGCSRVGPAGQS